MSDKKNIKIAVIEDDENLRFLVVHRLESEHYTVVEASNGNDAEELILNEKPDIVLLDWMLPGKQGSEVCAAVDGIQAQAVIGPPILQKNDLLIISPEMISHATISL